MPRMTRAKTAGQAQDVTDNITQSTSKSDKRKPEEQSGIIRKAPINGNQGSVIKKGVIAENQKKLMPRMTRAKTDGQAQDITDNITHTTA
eukprot:13389071-Ditylum_brightwellii.AAC.1